MFCDKFGRNTILIVDDTLLIRKYVTEVVKMIFNDVEVITAKNGLEGLDNYKANNNIALIITDIKMPIMSGHTMAGQIRLIEEYTERAFTPIVALTRYGDEQTREKNAAVNIISGLDKPISKENLLTILKKLSFI